MVTVRGPCPVTTPTVLSPCALDQESHDRLVRNNTLLSLDFPAGVDFPGELCRPSRHRVAVIGRRDPLSPQRFRAWTGGQRIAALWLAEFSAAVGLGRCWDGKAVSVALSCFTLWSTNT